MSIAPSPRVGIIIVAAGSGTRLGGAAPKAFVGIDAHSILWHCLGGVFAGPLAQVVIVAPRGREGDALTEALDQAGDRRDLVSVVVGGGTRQESVAAGIHALWAGVEIVLIHDAARAFTPTAVFARVIAAVDDGAAGVIPVLPVTDTIKRVDGQAIVDHIDRATLGAAQTPQGFRRDILTAAYAGAADDFTDDAALVAASGHDVRTVAGDRLSFKITTPDDLVRARAIVSGESVRDIVIPRVGVGTDVHAFGGEGTLWLAGLEWPGEVPLAGHSDGDAVAHAIVDALLAAAGLGDIGTHFGTAHPEYAGAHAAVFLSRTRELLADAGWTIGNVSVQVQANRPRFAGRRAEAEQVLSEALGGAAVSVSATTTDGLGFTGSGEGVSAFAVALVVPL